VSARSFRSATSSIGGPPLLVASSCSARETRPSLGNHEEKHFRFRRHEARRRQDPSYRNPVAFAEHHRLTQRAVSDDAWAWLEARCVPYLELPAHRVLAVHAGLQAGVPLGRQKPDRLCRVQMTKPGVEKSPWGGFARAASGEPILEGSSATRARAEGHRWWTEWLEPGGDVVVYGHSVMPAPLLSFHDGDAVKHAFATNETLERQDLAAVGIDTGVPFGGALTALLLPEWTFLRVDAERTYRGERSADA
jgi:hypothetical protein